MRQFSLLRDLKLVDPRSGKGGSASDLPSVTARWVQAAAKPAVPLWLYGSPQCTKYPLPVLPPSLTLPEPSSRPCPCSSSWLPTVLTGCPSSCHLNKWHPQHTPLIPQHPLCRNPHLGSVGNSKLTREIHKYSI